MKNELNESVQDSIKEYIDNVGDKKITDRTLEKLDKIHKEFIDEIHVQLKPLLKKNNELKIKIGVIKKRKAVKNSTKKEKVLFKKNVIDELISISKNYCDLNDIYREFFENVKFVNSLNKYEQWLNWALDFGEDSYLATHIAKLTHSSSKGSSIDVRYHESCDKYNRYYVCTASNPVLDTAYPDNKYSSISQLYNIKVGNGYVGDYLRNENEAIFSKFSENAELIKLWAIGFSKFIKNEKKKSYFLSKQIYFPICNEQYHLLMPLTSSSLVHAIHLEHKKYWDEEQEKTRSQKNIKKYSETTTCTYPNKAYLHVTGSNHSNASSLNGKRGGRVALLPAMPPVWKSNTPSYVNKVSIFDKSLAFELINEIKELKHYLLLIKNKSLSISEPKRNEAVINKLQAISSQFFNYLEMINLNESLEGWTANSKLPNDQQLVLEPWREDEAAMVLKLNNKWQVSLAQTYGRWLNNQLDKKSKLQLSPIQARLWTDCFLIELRERVAIQEVKV
ncbi:type I-F CRISPR-associated protein Csy1 [Aliivibrio kagoshimensis]|uniref:type I-F CRISPR-associated protein Csy1 n=1 Tax=Aliivibrio kagoshimensis TaxID=2910230 RepID=UPI003D104592